MKKFICLTLLLSGALHAGQLERSKAYKIHNRIAGVPPTPMVLNQMEQALNGGRMEEAVNLAMAHRGFTNTVLKNWLKPWSNVAKSSAVPLNDFVATAIGLIRDDQSFDQILYEDVLYHAPNPGITNVDPYARNNNEHYADLETQGLAQNMDWVAPLVRVTQSSMNTLPATATAGAITTRAFGEAYFTAGTNRRMTRFLFVNFLCHDFEELNDITVRDDRVRQDVERNPGNDSRTYRNQCVGCHAGQDALGGAWAFFNFTNGQGQYTLNNVQPKMLVNSAFYPEGWRTVDDSWRNYWAQGQNAKLGWDPNVPITGNGARSLGLMLSKTRAFGECMASRSWELLCMRKMKPSEKPIKTELAQEFIDGNYKIKQLFAATLDRCVTDEN